MADKLDYSDIYTFVSFGLGCLAGAGSSAVAVTVLRWHTTALVDWIADNRPNVTADELPEFIVVAYAQACDATADVSFDNYLAAILAAEKEGG